MTGPPCGVCGFTLRWLPQQASWGCDRCQRMFPVNDPGLSGGAAPWQASQQATAPGGRPPQQGFAPPQPQGFAPAQPQGFTPPSQGFHKPQPSFPPPQGFAPAQQQGFGAQRPSPQQSGHAPQAPAAAPAPVATAAGKSRKKLIIGLSAAIVVVAIALILFVVLRGGGPGGSREDVVDETLEALEDGDVEGLLTLADAAGVHDQLIACGSTQELELSQRDKEERDPKKQRERQREEFGSVAAVSVGAKIELVKFLNKEPPPPRDNMKAEGNDRVFSTGEELMRGCKAKVPVRMHEARLMVKVTAGDQPATEQEVTMDLIQIGTGFWLARPPRVSVGIGGIQKELAALRDKVCACTNADCAARIKQDFKASPRRKELEAQINALQKADRDKLEVYDDETRACEKKLQGGDQANEAIGIMTKFKERICACKDKYCVDKISAEMMVWAKSHDDDKLSEADLARVKEISEAVGACMVKIGAATPDAGVVVTGSGGDPGPTVPDVPPVASGDDREFPLVPGMPVPCNRYRNALQRISRCPSQVKAAAGFMSAWQQTEMALRLLPPDDTAKLDKIAESCTRGAIEIEAAIFRADC